MIANHDNVVALRKDKRVWWVKALAVAVTLVVAASGCAPCPAVGAYRPDLPASSSSDRLRVELVGNRIAQTNATPATLALTWTDIGPTELLITDAGKNVRLRHSARNASGRFILRLADDADKALPEGVYRVDVLTNGERAGASFEICHCTVFY